MRLIFENGEITLGDTLIPGIMTQVRIKNELIFDDFSIDSMSGNKKTPMGYSDADISVSMDLMTDDTLSCYDRLSAVNKLFKTVDENANTIVYTVLNSHCAARNIQKVYFSRLDSSESDQNDIITIDLSFVEYKPDVVKKEELVLNGSKTQNIETKVKPEFNLDVKLED